MAAATVALRGETDRFGPNEWALEAREVLPRAELSTGFSGSKTPSNTFF